MISQDDIDAFEYFNREDINMSQNYLPTDYQAFIHTSRYARWLDDEKRRESWSETVTRYVNNVVAHHVDAVTASSIEEAILGLEVMPSMRALMTAGPALDRDCLLYTSPSPRDRTRSRMPSSA